MPLEVVRFPEQIKLGKAHLYLTGLKFNLIGYLIEKCMKCSQSMHIQPFYGKGHLSRSLHIHPFLGFNCCEIIAVQFTSVD